MTDHTDDQADEQPRGPIEFRTYGAVTGVSFPDRTIDLIVMPYDEQATVRHQGRLIQEVIAPGAFDGIERRANRVRVNYQHQDDDLRQLLGRALTFHPDRDEGLVSTVKIRSGEYGDAALEAADAGDLGASAGFGIMPGGETWLDRVTRRLTRLFLDHIALTPTPAYKGARVLAVRSAEDDQPLSKTPNLDLVRSWRLTDAVRSDLTLMDR
jgi:HK97 family phage prohead protease